MPGSPLFFFALLAWVFHPPTQMLPGLRGAREQKMIPKRLPGAPRPSPSQPLCESAPARLQMSKVILGPPHANFPACRAAFFFSPFRHGYSCHYVQASYQEVYKEIRPLLSLVNEHISVN